MEGWFVRLLVNYREHQKGFIGQIEKILSDKVMKVNLGWNNESKSNHYIYLYKEDEDKFWELV